MFGGERDDDNVEERRLLDAVRATGRRSIARAASPAGIAQLSCATSPHSTMLQDGHIAWPGQAPCSPVAPTTDQPAMPWRPGMPGSQRAPPRRRIPGHPAPVSSSGSASVGDTRGCWSRGRVSDTSVEGLGSLGDPGRNPAQEGRKEGSRLVVVSRLVLSPACPPGDDATPM